MACASNGKGKGKVNKVIRNMFSGFYVKLGVNYSNGSIRAPTLDTRSIAEKYTVTKEVKKFSGT